MSASTTAHTPKLSGQPAITRPVSGVNGQGHCGLKVSGAKSRKPLTDSKIMASTARNSLKTGSGGAARVTDSSGTRAAGQTKKTIHSGSSKYRKSQSQPVNRSNRNLSACTKVDMSKTVTKAALPHAK